MVSINTFHGVGVRGGGAVLASLFHHACAPYKHVRLSIRPPFRVLTDAFVFQYTHVE